MTTSIPRVWVHVPTETVILITKQKEFTPLTNVEDFNGGAFNSRRRVFRR